MINYSAIHKYNNEHTSIMEKVSYGDVIIYRNGYKIIVPQRKLNHNGTIKEEVVTAIYKDSIDKSKLKELGIRIEKL